MKKMIFLAFALFLSGCVANGPIYQDAPPPPDGKALVYIYRAGGAAGGARSASFYVDGVEIADLNQDGYTWAHVPAGEHLLNQKWPIDVAFGRSTELNVYWKAGNTYYYRFATGAAFEGRLMQFIWAISGVDPVRGSREITVYKYQPAIQNGGSRLIFRSSGSHGILIPVTRGSSGSE